MRIKSSQVAFNKQMSIEPVLHKMVNNKIVQETESKYQTGVWNICNTKWALFADGIYLLNILFTVSDSQWPNNIVIHTIRYDTR